MTIKIEKGVPVPAKIITDWAELFDRMNCGESILLTWAEVNSFRSVINRSNGKFKVVIRKQDNGLMRAWKVWRG